MVFLDLDFVEFVFPWPKIRGKRIAPTILAPMHDPKVINEPISQLGGMKIVKKMNSTVNPFRSARSLGDKPVEGNV